MKSHLSPRDLGRAIGVSESSLKRWIDEGRIEAGRTEGGHRRVHLAEAVRYIREAGLPVLQPELLGLGEVGQLGPGFDPHALTHQSFSAALQEANVDAARGTILSMYLAGESVADIVDRVIAPALHEIGTLWQHSDAGIYVEHRAVDLCVQAIQQLRGVLPTPSADAPVAVGAAPSSDPYLLPSLCAAVTLEAEGWRVNNLGPETPFHVLALAAENAKATLVWLSVSVKVNEKSFTKEVDALARRLHGHGARLVVGGQKLPRSFATPQPHVHVAANMAELVDFAKQQAAAAE